MFIFLTSVNATYTKDFNRLDALLGLIAKGDKQALSELYAIASPSVYGFALSILKNAHDAEDVLQSCFVKIWDSAGQYRKGTKPIAWILTVTKNLCYMKLREQKKSENFDQDELCLLSSPDNTSLTVENRTILEAAFKLIGDDQRQIVMLHAVSGLKFREIATLLEKPLATVISKYHRAIKKMQTALGGEIYE